MTQTTVPATTSARLVSLDVLRGAVMVLMAIDHVRVYSGLPAGGPTLALIPWLERARGPVTDWLTVFGRVRFFYYVLHIPLIHLLALVVSALRLEEVSPWLFGNHPMGIGPAPEGYTWSLRLLYLVFVVAIGLLYHPCRWFAGLKASRNEPWLRYL